MSTVHPTPEFHEIDWLTPAAREILQAGRKEAYQMRAAQIFPEHLLAGILILSQSKTSNLLQHKGIDITVLRTRAGTTLPAQTEETDEQQLSFSTEAEQCIHNAIALITYDRARYGRSVLVSPEHLALSLFAHPRVQQMLAPYSTIILNVRERLLEGRDLDFRRYMDSVFLFSDCPPDGRRKVINFVSVNQSDNRRILKCVEHPDLTFKDVIKLDKAKHALRDIIIFLRNPQNMVISTRGVLLIDKQDIDLRQFVRAIAGEAGVPLTMVFCSVISELINGKNHIDQFQAILREIFLPLKMFSYCVVYLDDIDTLLKTIAQHTDKQASLLASLCTEIDKLMAQPGMVLLSATSTPNNFPQELLLSKRLGLRILIDERIRLASPPALSAQAVPIQAEAQKSGSILYPAQLSNQICTTCQKSVEPHWKFCIYCRSPLARNCVHCGAPRPTIPDAKFCFECGEPLDA